MFYAPQVHAHDGPKIVCCEPGFEAMYPSADRIIHVPTRPDHRRGPTAKDDHYFAELESVLRKQVRGPVTFVRPSREAPKSYFVPKPRETYGIECDVVVCPRRRQHGSQRNWEHWQYVIDELRNAGLRVFAAGSASGSVDVDCPRAWDYPRSLDATLEAMAAARVVVATDTGLAHLAVLAGRPLIMVCHETNRVSPRSKRIQTERFERENHLGSMHRIVPHSWLDPGRIIRATLDYLAEPLPTYIKQYGKERTGTNYLRAMIKENFPDSRVLMNVLGWKHGMPEDPHAWLRANKTERGQILAVTSAPTGMSKPTDLTFAELDEALRGGRVHNVVSVKHPYQFLESIRRQWPDRDLREECRDYNRKYQAWLQGDPIVIRHEDLRADCNTVMERLADRLKLKKPTTYRDVIAVVKPSNDFNLRLAHEPYEPQADEVSDPIRSLADAEIDWDLAGRMGYERVVLPLTQEAIKWEAPDSGRRGTIVKALQALHSILGGPAMIVEVGTSRNAGAGGRKSDGWSTRMFGWYASRVSGRLISIDSDPKALEAAKKVASQYLDVIEFQQGDGLALASRVDREIDLLYMDGPSEAEFHLNVYRALRHRPRLVLFDDIRSEPYGVKGGLAIPAMLEDGYREVVRTVGRHGQALYARGDTTIAQESDQDVEAEKDAVIYQA